MLVFAEVGDRPRRIRRWTAVGKTVVLFLCFFGGFDICWCKGEVIFGLAESNLDATELDDLTTFELHFGFVGPVDQNTVGGCEIFHKILAAFAINPSMPSRDRTVNDRENRFEECAQW